VGIGCSRQHSWIKVITSSGLATEPINPMNTHEQYPRAMLVFRWALYQLSVVSGTGLSA